MLHTELLERVVTFKLLVEAIDLGEVPAVDELSLHLFILDLLLLCSHHQLVESLSHLRQFIGKLSIHLLKVLYFLILRVILILIIHSILRLCLSNV